MKPVSAQRPSPIAGRWYSGDALALGKSIDKYLDSAQIDPLPGEVVAVIAPHAGHIYSGAVAGHAFRAVLGQHYDLVVVISPMHGYDPHPLLTSAHQSYHTPLGAVEIDRASVTQLDSLLHDTLGFGLAAVAYDDEHSLEIELPFLQRALSGTFKLLPVMMRDQDAPTARALGTALARVISQQRCLLVASTDLSHFYTENEAQRLDSAILEQVGAFSPEGIYTVEAGGQGFACGIGAITSVLWAAQELGAGQVKVLKYATSATVTGDTSSVVGYGAAVVLKSA